MFYFVGFIIPLISYLFQIYPRLINRYFGVDVWSRMLEADFIRRNGHRVPMQKISDGFILEGYFNYPPVLPWLLSFLSKKTLLGVQGFIAPLFDVIQNILVFIAILQLTGNIAIAVLGQIIYATIPLAILENSYLTPRSLGYLTFTVAFYPLILYSLVPNPFYLTVGFMFTVLCFFTHRFATQSLLFMCVFFSIIDRNPFYLAVFFGAMIVAIITSRGYYLRVLDGHIANIYFWVLNYKLRFAHQVRGIVKKRQKWDFVSLVYFVLGKFTPVTLIGTNLWIVVPVFFLLEKLFGFGIIPQEILMEPLYFKMSLWVLFCYVLGALVLSIPYLQPIGEGQRYLEMALAPTAIVAAVTFSPLWSTGYAVIATACFVLILCTNIALTFISQWMGIINDKYRSLHKDMREVFAFINTLKPASRILCIPHQITTMVLYNTKASVLVDIQTGTLQRIRDVYPILRSSVQDIAKKYNLNMLILKKYFASMEELKLDKKSLIFETEETQIFKL
ncbi:MAG: hypothetical protein A3B53_02330 [Candidatus Levybacteria bacterium RIFCSPLOWO2_01_FULL_42_15]|nr:MAG: hypothetical protein A3B53_02330 [Candidatus Levybacteria bacterium RIFCSPLOWO2_01_FULL_42_15]